MAPARDTALRCGVDAPIHLGLVFGVRTEMSFVMELTTGQSQVLAGLRARWEDLSIGGSQLVVVHGRPGSGKTALVQAFYEYAVQRAAREHPATAVVWPAVLGDGSTPRRVARKSVSPACVADPWGRLGLAWFGRTCREGEGTAAVAGVLEELISEQTFQALYLDRDWTELGADEDGFRALIAFAAAGGAGLMFGQAGSAAVGSRLAFDGEAGRLARTVMTEEATWRHVAERVGRLPWDPQGTPSRAQVLAGRFAGIAELGVPVVLALEDAHLADEGTIALCQAVLDSPGTQALIVATADTDEFVGQMEARRGFGALLVDEPASRHVGVIAVLADPEPAEMERIVRSVLPTATDADTVERIVLAATGSIERAVVLTEGAALESAVSPHWDAMAQTAQRYLAAVAALQGPVFYRQPLDELVGLCRADQEEGQRVALLDGVIVRVDQWRYAFVDPAWHRAARERASTMFSDDQLEPCRQDLFDSISFDKRERPYWSALPVPVQATALSDHVGLYSRAAPDDQRETSDDQLNRVGEELLDSLDRLAGLQAANDQPLAAAHSIARAVDMMRSIRRAGGSVGAERELEILSRYYYLPDKAWELAGLIEEAGLFADVLAEMFGTGSAGYLQARWNVANLHAAVYDFGRAFAIADQVLEQDAGYVSLRQLHTWRHDCAAWAAEAGKPAVAVDLCRHLLPDCGAHAFSTRNSMGRWLGEAAQFDDAIRVFEQLLRGQIRLLGADHPDTLTTRSNLAGVVGEAGRLQDAAEQLRELLRDQIRVLGSDHPATLITRDNLASVLGDAGRLGDAINQAEQLLRDRTRVLGPDHPQTFASRNNLADFLGRSGHIDDAIDRLEQLLPDETRVLGPDHPHTLTSRHNLAYWLRAAGRIDDAINHLEELRAGQTRVLGADHLDTLATGANLRELRTGG